MQNSVLRRVVRFGQLAGVAALIGISTDVSSQSTGPTIWNDLPNSAVPDADYCVVSTGQCYTSRAAAETAMRAGTTIGPYLREKFTSFVSSGVMDIVYGADDRAPEHIYGPGYQNGWKADASVCPQSDIPNLTGATVGGYCNSEQSAVDAIYNWLLYSYPECVHTEIGYSGSYVNPMYMVDATTASAGRMLHYNSSPRRKFTYMVQCPGWAEPDQRVINLSKFSEFVCPAGFRPISDYLAGKNPNGASGGVVWPNLCTTGETHSIRTVIRPSSCLKIGHPCSPSTGDKSRQEVDFEFAGRQFSRFYHSRPQWRKDDALGVGWTHSFSDMTSLGGTRFYIDENGGYWPLLNGGNGQLYVPGTGATLLQNNWESDMFFPNGDVYHFDDYGNVTSIKNARDPRRNITLTYSGLGADLRLTAMTDISGRSVQLSYMSGRLSSILLPTGQTITYGYDVRANLTSVDYGNGQVKQYVYGESGLAPNGDAGLLTGIISEDGKRYGTFGYDEYGRVISSVLHGENGPTESTDLRFPDATHTVVKTMTGELQTYAFTSDQYRRPLSIASNARSESSTYDSHGRKLSHTDGRGVQTTYAYNASGQLSQQIEAANDTTGDKRTTQTDWHATLNVPVARRVLDAAGQWVSQ
ncbi:DUF6531 domain-containing protein, partial [Solilutibacter pythonis]